MFLNLVYNTIIDNKEVTMKKADRQKKKLIELNNIIKSMQKDMNCCSMDDAVAIAENIELLWTTASELQNIDVQNVDIENLLITCQHSENKIESIRDIFYESEKSIEALKIKSKDSKLLPIEIRGGIESIKGDLHSCSKLVKKISKNYSIDSLSK